MRGPLTPKDLSFLATSAPRAGSSAGLVMRKGYPPRIRRGSFSVAVRVPANRARASPQASRWLRGPHRRPKFGPDDVVVGVGRRLLRRGHDVDLPRQRHVWEHVFGDDEQGP